MRAEKLRENRWSYAEDAVARPVVGRAPASRSRMACADAVASEGASGWREAVAAPVPVAVPTTEERLALALAAVEAALDAIRTPAVFVDTSGRVVQANGIARERARAAHMVAATRLDGGTREPTLQVTPLVVECAVAGYLVVQRADAAVDNAERLARAARTWRLTRRQATILGHVAAGLSNKDIAAKTGLAVRTVELHVSAVLRKSGTEARTALAARFWSLP